MVSNSSMVTLSSLGMGRPALRSASARCIASGLPEEKSCWIQNHVEAQPMKFLWRCPRRDTASFKHGHNQRLAFECAAHGLQFFDIPRTFYVDSIRAGF